MDTPGASGGGCCWSRQSRRTGGFVESRHSARSVTTWEDGARAQTSARSFQIATDEPLPLGGTERAVDLMELLLASLGTCLTIAG